MFDRRSPFDDLLLQVAAALEPLRAEAGAARDDLLIDILRSVEAVGRWVDAARVTLAGEIAQRSRPTLGAEGLATARGCRSAAELIERVTLVSGATARARIRTATSLRGETSLTGDELPGPFPLVASALDDGTLGIDAASTIVASLAPILHRGVAEGPVPGIGVVGGVAAAEAALVAAATGGDVDGVEPARSLEPAAPADDIRVMAQTWALFLDPDGVLADEHTAQRRRGITFGRMRGGTVPVRGELLPEVAAQWKRLEDAYLNPRVASGPRFEESPDELDGPLDPRSSTQKRHDALAGILTVAAGMDDVPQLGGAAPVLVVTVDAEELDRDAGAAFIQGADDAPLSIAAARHVGCSGAVQRVRVDGFGRIVSLGAPQRIFNRHQRRAIAQRDGGCVIPGCHVPATWCEVHHVEEAARGGPTHTDNGVLLCWHHHRTIETNGWEIRMISGVPWVRAPRWLDLSRRWRPSVGSQHRQLAKLRRDPAGTPPASATGTSGRPRGR
jgi:hypothetical protein